MKTMQDFKNIEKMEQYHQLKQDIDKQLLSKPLGQKLREYHQFIKQLVKTEY